uniref:Uncharacterized protein n=1 Tax=Arundo donax TaxID=35708 RepID=A0A0A8ZJE5_ARUDO
MKWNMNHRKQAYIKMTNLHCHGPFFFHLLVCWAIAARIRDLLATALLSSHPCNNFLNNVSNSLKPICSSTSYMLDCYIRFVELIGFQSSIGLIYDDCMY